MDRYYIRAKGEGKNKTGEVLIYEDIGGSDWMGGLSAKQFASDLQALGKVEQLDIRINSAGGDVFDGVAIYNQLRRHPAYKAVSIDGMALSIASVIAMAGDHVSMAENAMMMIHDPWSIMMGNAADFREQAELLDQIKENLVLSYSRKAKGASVDHLREMMAKQTWLSAADAVDEGLADEVTAHLEVNAWFPLDRFKNVPQSVRARVMRAQPTPRLDTIRARLRQNSERMRAAA